MRAIFCTYIILVFITNNVLAICECGQKGVKGCQNGNGSFTFCDGWEAPVTEDPRMMQDEASAKTSRLMLQNPDVEIMNNTNKDYDVEMMNNTIKEDEYDELINTSLSPIPPSTPHTSTHLGTTADPSVIYDINSGSGKIDGNSATGGNIQSKHTPHTQTHKDTKIYF